jgi:hypothetical protein
MAARKRKPRADANNGNTGSTGDPGSGARRGNRDTDAAAPSGREAAAAAAAGAAELTKTGLHVLAPGNGAERLALEGQAWEATQQDGALDDTTSEDGLDARGRRPVQL